MTTMPLIKKKNSGCGALCTALQWVVALLLLLASVAALIGVWNTHVTNNGFAFGGSSASLALIAFAISVTLCKKSLCCLCGACSPK
jgi:hypothetical protein